MAQSLIWTQEALEDIDNIAEYISHDSLYHAQQVVERIFDLGGSLPEQPELGRVVPELDKPQVRERFIYSYRLIFEIVEPEQLIRLFGFLGFQFNLFNVCRCVEK